MSTFLDDINSLEEKRDGLDLNQFTVVDHIRKVRDQINQDYQTLLPKDPQKLRNLNEILYQKFSQLAEQYSTTLQELNNQNESLRSKAVKYYEDYKNIKKKVYKDEVALNKDIKILKKELDLNNSENEKLLKNIYDYKANEGVFLSKIGAKNETDVDNLAIISESEKTDGKVLGNALKKISEMGIDILKDMKVSEEEFKILSIIIGSSLEENSGHNIEGLQPEQMDIGNIKNNINASSQNQPDQNMGQNLDDLREDFDLGNQIVAFIEQDVNDLYLKRKIEQVRIDQTDAITYSFTGEKGEKEVTLKIVKNRLYCADGQLFTDWLLNNFGSK